MGAERSKKCSASAERATLVKQLRSLQGKNQEGKRNQTVLEKKFEDNNSMRCTEVEGASENTGQEEKALVRTTSHQQKPTLPRQSDCHITTRHKEKPTVPRHSDCHIRSSSSTWHAGCHIRSSSGNWHAGAFRNSLKAKSPVKTVQNSFEMSTSPLKTAGEEVRQVLTRESEKSCQTLSDHRPPVTPRKSMLGSYSPRSRVLQGNNAVVPLGSVTPELHKSVEPRTPSVSVEERIRRFEPRSGGR